MKPITFLDLEVNPETRRILDMGAVTSQGRQYHSHSIGEFMEFLRGAPYLCGHNLVHHDLSYLKPHLDDAGITNWQAIDTLYWSPMLFPRRPYHALVKDEKLFTDELNNPLSDSQKAKDLFFDQVSAFQRLDAPLKRIFFCLLVRAPEFSGLFHYLDYHADYLQPEKEILAYFQNLICSQVHMAALVREHPVELAYALALIATRHRFSITPPWVLRNYPQVSRITNLLRNKPCLTGCPYCDSQLDPVRALEEYFGFSAYRTFGGEALQESSVAAAITGQSLVAIFPTGGGKSITFQVPALLAGDTVRGLTVVISPLQSLMKDQVDNLERSGILQAVTINGLLDPIERAKALERVHDGSASILYISPESLRSRTIERAILDRNVVRFVVDEAHCFSSWGQDFRVDYLYIADFIKMIQEKKGLQEPIPVSCFTATAKPVVVEDIRRYFKDRLGLELGVFAATVGRTNLHYQVIEEEGEEKKYNTLRNLISEKQCPTIVYVSRTKRAWELASRLEQDGFRASPYHGKMDKKEKSENQDAFIAGELDIIVATSAFGMGVDKKDVGMVIHYEISDSLENYVQEAGRAGRDASISAQCYVLFNEEDLDKHFLLLNQTKIHSKEIQQVWTAIKEMTRLRSRVSQSALEIARKAGWDENMNDLETRVKTAIASLELSGYVQRGQNMPRVFADSILVKNMEAAREKIMSSPRYENEKERETAIRIMGRLISGRSYEKAMTEKEKRESVEGRVDYIAERLGLEREEVIRVVNLLREDRLLADALDLSAFITRGEKGQTALRLLDTYRGLEEMLAGTVGQEEAYYNLKLLNEEGERRGIRDSSVKHLKNLLNYLAITKGLRYRVQMGNNSYVSAISQYEEREWREKMEVRYALARFILEFLLKRGRTADGGGESGEKVTVEFSVQEIREAYEAQAGMFGLKVTAKDVEESLYFLCRIEAMQIEGGFLVLYMPMQIERLELDNRRKYRKEDYRKLEEFYESRVQQIHIVGEYARKMIADYNGALQFVEDYFQLPYEVFLGKYFPGSRREEIRRKITPRKFRQLFGVLSPAQLQIIKDGENPCLVVLAGPGSGKTRVLVHKLASLLLMEDVKHEQLLMLTFTRAAATEFSHRLRGLIGNGARFVEIKTFHSYCFDLLGKVGSVASSEDVVAETVARIRSGDVERSRITRLVLVIDEAQDMDRHVFALVEALMEANEEMRVIAVGDDDQNIFAFRGSSADYMQALLERPGAVRYELLENYRSRANLVAFANGYGERRLTGRLKEHGVVPHDRGSLGRLELVRYGSTNLVVPLVEAVVREVQAGGDGGSSAVGSSGVGVLTTTNEEALQVAGLLWKRGVPARILQGNDGFSLGNLAEIRHFIEEFSLDESSPVIGEDLWNGAKRSLVRRYGESDKLELCKNLILEFEKVYPGERYKTDFQHFVRESSLEDLVRTDGQSVVVSTIHKAKGREFDQVFLLLSPRFREDGQEARRQLYVALTRAKEGLFIHCQGEAPLAGIPAVEGMVRRRDDGEYPEAEEVILQPGVRGVHLDYFISRQALVDRLQSGMLLEMQTTQGGQGQSLCWEGKSVLRFSKKYLEDAARLEAKGYQALEAKVNFIVYWKKEGAEEEVKIILPQITYRKKP